MIACGCGCSEISSDVAASLLLLLLRLLVHYDFGSEFLPPSSSLSLSLSSSCEDRDRESSGLLSAPGCLVGLVAGLQG